MDSCELVMLHCVPKARQVNVGVVEPWNREHGPCGVGINGFKYNYKAKL